MIMRLHNACIPLSTSLALLVALTLMAPLSRAQTVPSTMPDQPALKPPELEALLAPIALYPDSLITQMLMASTYPLEIVQADRWVKANKALKGKELTAALEKQTWDASVKSLVNFPEVLAMMSE